MKSPSITLPSYQSPLILILNKQGAAVQIRGEAAVLKGPAVCHRVQTEQLLMAAISLLFPLQLLISAYAAGARADGTRSLNPNVYPQTSPPQEN